jgi:hypothetical protein
MTPRASRSDFGGPCCPRCRRDLDPERVLSGPLSCPHCGRAFEATRFDPPPPRVEVRAVEEAGPGAAASCPAHRGNVAAANCSRCGVFMCDLCRIDADGMVLCPACFDRLSAEGALPSARTTFRDFGRMGATLLLVGLVFSVFAAPFTLGAVYAGARELRQRKTLGEGSAVRAWVVIALGVLGTLGSAAFWVAVARA